MSGIHSVPVISSVCSTDSPSANSCRYSGQSNMPPHGSSTITSVPCGPITRKEIAWYVFGRHKALHPSRYSTATRPLFARSATAWSVCVAASRTTRTESDKDGDPVGQPFIALSTACMMVLIATGEFPGPNDRQGVYEPRAMDTPVMSSFTVTTPSPLQSPIHPVTADVGVGVGVKTPGTHAQLPSSISQVPR